MANFLKQNPAFRIALVLVSIFCLPTNNALAAGANENIWAQLANECSGITIYGPVPDGSWADGLPSERMLPMPDLKAGKIVGTGPSFFLGAGCTSTPEKCKLPNQPYLVSGDPVIITTSIPGYLCVTYANRTKRSYSGWMPTSRIKIDQPIALSDSLASWVGTWRDGSTTIILSKRGHQLLAYGDAVWQGLYAPHFGKINAAGMPEGNTLTLGESDQLGGCYVKLLRTSNLLVAIDNGGCGGMNVTFSGIYVRK